MRATHNDNYQPARAWFITVLLALFMLINFIDKVVIGLVAVPMMAELKLSPTEFGWIAGSFFWLFSASGVVGGFIANRVSAKWMLLVMAATWSVAQLPIILSSSIAMFVLSRVLLGIGEGPAAPIAYHACYKWFPDRKRALPVSVVNQGAAIGVLMAGVLIPLITVHWGWRANFLVMAIAGAVWVLVWLVFGAEGRVADEAGSTQASGAERRLPYRVLLTDSTVLGVLVMNFMAYWGLALTLTWFPAYLQKGLGFDGLAAGRLFAMLTLVNIVCSLGLSWWSQRLLARGVPARKGRAVLASGALIVGGLMIVAVVLLPMPVLAKVFLLAAGGGITGVMFSLAPAMVGSVSPDTQRGAMLAILNSVASIAGVLSPVITGSLIQSTSGDIASGYEHGFALSGALLAAGGVIGLLWAHPERSIARLARGRPLTPALSPEGRGSKAGG
ncbi:MFS transporter [Variovorax sp. dw_308]|uniref:MFS transporter n=1 Tax=Variovorax sp. dw_308 TaxID=2721546 RepID=UPI001C458B0F|nr:MFS transporter [Variovorax sp. dw_308]